MRRLLRLFFSCLVFLPFVLLGAAWLAVSDQPALNRSVDLSPERLDKAHHILESNNPTELRPGEVRGVKLSEDDIDLAVNYLAHRYVHGSAQVRLKTDALALDFTAALPAPWAGRYVNGAAELVPTESGLMRFTGLRLGRLPVPAWLANFMLARVLAHFDGKGAEGVIDSVIRRVFISDGRLTLVYEWRNDLPARLSGAVVPEADLARIRAYRQLLVEVGAKAKPGVSLAELLEPLLRLAGQRSAGGEPVAENRAALVALTFYVNHRGLDKIDPQSKGWPGKAMRFVKLEGRDDFPKHFIISAALAATADTPLADAVGLYKEVKDSRGGSGFSFNDIAADRAGVRMGEASVRSEASALDMQRRVSAGLREPDFMPSTQGLPEFMPEEEFKRRFGGIGAPKYLAMMAEIEKRIAALPLYRR